MVKSGFDPEIGDNERRESQVAEPLTVNAHIFARNRSATWELILQAQLGPQVGCRKQVRPRGPHGSDLRNNFPKSPSAALRGTPRGSLCGEELETQNHAQHEQKGAVKYG